MCPAEGDTAVGSHARHFLPTAAALLGGIVSWIAYLQVLKWANQFVWIPLGHLDRVSFEVSATAVPVYLAFGAAIAMLRTQLWWTRWLAFVAGVVICIGVRSAFHRDALELAIGILRRSAFLTAMGTSGITLFLVSRFLGARPNPLLERTRER
jgi:hypothetical protein